MSASQAIASYAALILADADIEITADKILAIAKSSGAELEPIWAETFAKATEGHLKEIILSFATAGPAAGAAPAAEEAPKEESESDGDMGMGLFD